MPTHFNFIEDIQEIILRDLTVMIDEVNGTPDNLLWTNFPGISNSVGALAYHLCGNLKHFIGAVIGNDGYIRQRDEEFNPQPLNKSELIAEIASTKNAVNAALTALSMSQLEEVMPDTPPQHTGRTIGFFLIQLTCHLSRHRGQLDYLRRILIANSGN